MKENQNAPTVKVKRGVDFYNPGDRFTEVINYSLDGIGDIHAIARWTIDAEEKSVFKVPTEFLMMSDNQRVGVDFPTTVTQRFRNRGVLLIDEDYEVPQDEDDDDQHPFAHDLAHAKVKGARMWVKFLQDIVRNHIESVLRARSFGGMPVEASGFTKRAFRLLNMKDPAAVEFAKLADNVTETKFAPSGNDSKEIAALKQENSEQKKKMDDLQGMMAKLLRKLEAKEQVEQDEKTEELVSASVQKQTKQVRG